MTDQHRRADDSEVRAATVTMTKATLTACVVAVFADVHEKSKETCERMGVQLLTRDQSVEADAFTDRLWRQLRGE